MLSKKMKKTTRTNLNTQMNIKMNNQMNIKMNAKRNTKMTSNRFHSQSIRPVLILLIAFLLPASVLGTFGE